MNGVQGVASSNLVIPTRISGSCDGESRLPFLLNFFRPGLSSHRAVFSRAAGDSQSRLVPRFRGRIAPSAETPQAVRASDSLPRTRRSWLVFFCALLFVSPGGCGKASSVCKKEGGEAPWKNVLGNFPRRPKRFGRTAQLLKKSRRVGETGIFGRQSPALPGTLSPAVGTRFPRASMQPLCDGEHVSAGSNTIAFKLFFLDCIFIFLHTYYKHDRQRNLCLIGIIHKNKQ